MSSVWVTMPAPPDGEQWCTACAMLAKGQVNKTHDQEGKAAVADGKPDTVQHWIAAKVTVPLQVAVVRGLWDMMPQLGILDLCWTHIAGATWETASTLLARPNGPLPPGLAKGRG